MCVVPSRATDRMTTIRNRWQWSVGLWSLVGLALLGALSAFHAYGLKSSEGVDGHVQIDIERARTRQLQRREEAMDYRGLEISPRGDNTDWPVTDDAKSLFAVDPWAPQAVPVVVAPPPPPPPSAPPLPFNYLGRMVDSPAETLYLRQGERTVIAKVGDVLDGVYRLETASESGLDFVYLPLDARQTLAIPAR